MEILRNTIIGKVKNVYVYPSGDKYLCFALIEQPNFAKIVYRGPIDSVIQLISCRDKIQFESSSSRQKATYKGAEIPMFKVDTFTKI